MLKFENVNILKSLKTIMKIHTKHFQSDFEQDIKKLKQAAKSQNTNDKNQIWLCRSNGTWCLREREIFIRDSREYRIFCHYAEQTNDKILAYAIELIDIKKGKVIGNLYELNYQNYYKHIKDVSVLAGDAMLIYEKGNIMQKAGKRITGMDDQCLGKFIGFEEQPQDYSALQNILKDESNKRNRFDIGDINIHIKKLSVKKT